MSTRSVRYGGAWVVVGAAEGGGGGLASDQFPRFLSDGFDSATSGRNTITVTSSATPHAPGAWVEIDASLSGNASALEFYLTTSTIVTSADSSTLLEIGTGASGAEVVAATVAVGYQGFAGSGFVIPGYIAAGTRVAVRARSAIASKSVSAIFVFRRSRTVALGASVTFGANTATSRGVDLPQPSAVNTKSDWAEITASTPADLVALFVNAQGAGDTAMGASFVSIDIGIGAAGSETVLISDVFYNSGSNEALNSRMPTTFGVDVPAGTRLSARWARQGTTDSVDVFLVGALAA